jgi:hypothetical protein
MTRLALPAPSPAAIDLRSGEADQRQRPHTGRLAVQIAVEPERCARERGRSQPQDDLGGVHGSAS